MDISKFLNIKKLDSLSTKPLYLQISDLIVGEIQNHNLPVGTKLPPERELAALFTVSRTTAINAYRHLEQLGLVKTKVGSGTYVDESGSSPNQDIYGVPWNQLFTSYPQSPSSSVLRELVSTAVSVDNISLAAGMPDPDYYPTKTLSDLFKTNVDCLNKADFGHIPTEGYNPLRQNIAKMLDAKEITVTPNNIAVLSGSQQGLYLLSKVLLEPGDYVIVESPTFIGAIQVFQNAGARILTLPASGPFPFQLMEDFLIRYRPKMFYIMPTFHNPNGRVLPMEDRKQLLELASRHRLVIIEDDPYSELYYDTKPPLSLKSLDTYGGVVYLNTFSKILFPGLRTGYIAAHPALINRIALEKQYNDLHSNNISQWLINLYLEAGHLPIHLANVRKEYKKRRNIAVKAIQRFCGDNIEFSIPEGGYYLWCKLHNSVKSRALLHEAKKYGVSFVCGQAFYANPTSDNELRLSFVNYKESILIEGIKRLAKAFDQAQKNDKNTNSFAISSNPPIV